MNTIKQPAAAHRFIEGGVFYPTGYIVAAFPNAEDAMRVQRDLATGGYEPGEDCCYAPPEAIIEEAEADVRGRGPLALFGHSLQTREVHLDLAAREGCHFLTIHASSNADENRVIRVLSRVPVRYVVKYHLFVIEEITNRVPSAVQAAVAA